MSNFTSREAVGANQIGERTLFIVSSRDDAPAGDASVKREGPSACAGAFYREDGCSPSCRVTILKTPACHFPSTVFRFVMSSA